MSNNYSNTKIKWSEVHSCIDYLYESERYILGFVLKDGNFIDQWYAFVNRMELPDVDYRLVKYKTGYYLMPFYKGEPIINTNLDVIRKSDQDAINCVNYIFNAIKQIYPNPEQYKPEIYNNLYQRLSKTGVVKIDNLIETLFIPPKTSTQSGTNNLSACSFDDTANKPVMTEVLNPWDIPEESEIKDFSSIVRPFEGEPFKPGIHTEEDHIIIPRDTKPRFSLACNLFNVVNCDVGLPISKTRVLNLYKETQSKLKILDKRIKSMLNTDMIDYSGRNETNYNIGVLYCNYCGQYVDLSNHRKKGKITFTLKHLEDYLKMFNDNLDKPACQDMYDLTQDIIEYKTNSSVLSQLKDFYRVVLGNAPDKPCNDIWATLDREDEDIYWVHPNIHLAETNRFQCSNPNPQGKTACVKECITAPKGYSIMSLDISAQDVYVLVWGIMQDKEMQENVIKMGDPYKALLQYCGYEPTKENKKILKTPLLSRMNGKMIKTIISESKYPDKKHMIVDSLNKIENESGYRQTVNSSSKESVQPQPKRSGLFGTRKYISNASDFSISELSRKILNANFQMTSAEILCISYLTMMHDLMNGRIEGYDDDVFIPLLPIHDEIVAMCRDDKIEECKNLMKYYILPSVEGWGRMNGEITVNKHYEHK